jgi:hypothetical protein
MNAKGEFMLILLGEVIPRPSRIGAATVGLNVLRYNSQQCETVRKKQKK